SSIEDLRGGFASALAAARSLADVKSIRDEYLSRKQGHVTALLKAVGAAPPDERKTLGAAANALRLEIETALDAREADLARSAPPPDAVAVTLPGRIAHNGRR